MMFLGFIRSRLGSGGITTEVLDDLREGSLVVVALVLLVVASVVVLLVLLTFSGGIGADVALLVLLTVANAVGGAVVVVVGATAALKGESQEAGDENKVDRLDCRKLGGACLGRLRSGLPVVTTAAAAATGLLLMTRSEVAALIVVLEVVVAVAVVVLLNSFRARSEGTRGIGIT